MVRNVEQERFDIVMKEAGNAPFDADEEFGKEIPAYPNPNAFKKNDSQKPQWSLLPFEEVESVVRVLEMGARKYSRDNWKKCDNPRRYEDALMRHVIAYMQGRKVDEESGISHLAHAVCNCLFLMWFDRKGKE